MSNLGCYDAWYFQTIGNSKLFLSIVRQRIKDQFVQNWSSRLNNSSRAIFYRNISDFSFQQYLELISNRKLRINLSGLRLSSHRLSIETGRWNQPVSLPINQRLCTFCNCLEDEFHFVMECTQYSEIRKELLPRYYWSRPNMYKFIELMNIRNKRTVKQLSIFVDRAFTIRNTALYN